MLQFKLKKVYNPKCNGKKDVECYDLINTKITKKREACTDCKGCCNYISTKKHCDTKGDCDERHIQINMKKGCTECNGSCCDYLETSSANVTEVKMVNFL